MEAIQVSCQGQQAFIGPDPDGVPNCGRYGAAITQAGDGLLDPGPHPIGLQSVSFLQICVHFFTIDQFDQCVFPARQSHQQFLEAAS